MSNWSSIVLCWSGIDEDAQDEMNRMREIANGMYHRDSSWSGKRGLLSPSCNAASIGSAVETVVLYHANHFDPNDLLQVLLSLKWEFPNQVEFFWKHEQMDNYQRVGLIQGGPADE